MEGQAANLKIDLLLAIQLNHYDQAYALAQQILQLRPHDELIRKFHGFLEQHRTEMKEIQQDEVEVQPVQIECTDSEGSHWESDYDESFSISEESGSEDQQDAVVEKQSPIKTPQKPIHECRSVKASPVRNPSVGSIKQLQPKILQPAKSSIIKKPVEVTTFKGPAGKPVLKAAR